MNTNIFINYRTDDAAQAAGRLYERLILDLPSENVFFDIHRIEGGGDIRKRIDEALDTCVVILVIIGPRWLQADTSGQRRIDDADDWVKYEIRRAFEKNVHIIPVLVDGARLPSAADLPADIAFLRERLAREVRHPRFQADADDLKREIIRLIFSQIRKDTSRTIRGERGSATQPLATAVAAALEAAHSAFAATLDKAISPLELSGATPTGLRELDRILGGMRPAELIVIAGPPGIGKTDLATAIGFNVAQTLLEGRTPDQGPQCAYFSMDLSAEDLATRILVALSEIPIDRIRRGVIDETDFSRLVAASQRMADLPLYIDQTKGLSFAKLGARIQSLANRHAGILLTIVDPLQAIDRQREQPWSEIAFALKGLAAKLASPMIVLLRIPANSERRSECGPERLDDLGEFRDIGMTADKVIFLHRADYYLAARQPPANNEEGYRAWLREWELTQGISEACIAKNAGGKTGTVTLGYDAATHRYRDL